MRLGHLIKIAAAFVALAALTSMTLVYHWHLGARSAVTIACSLLFAILLIAVFIVWNWLFQARAQAIVRKWAAEHGYAILHLEGPFFIGGFSLWTTSRGQVVYSVTLRDKEGSERKAWVRCGGHVGSVLFSDAIEVKWKDEAKNP